MAKQTDIREIVAGMVERNETSVTVALGNRAEVDVVLRRLNDTAGQVIYNSISVECGTGEIVPRA